MKTDLDVITVKVDALLKEVLEYSLFGGGKRFRPLLTVMSARLLGNGENGDELYKLAVAFEYLHVATLLHDDVIDNGLTRRGRPTVHLKYGMVPAILAGDFLHARAMSIVGSIGGMEALNVFCGATRAMVDGEFVQMRNTENYNQSVDQYFQGILGKTALLIGAAAEVGCIFRNGGSRERSALNQYGVNLGCAFQIIDDLLDYQGEESLTGKKCGNDLVEGKITLPLIITLNRADEKERSRIMQILASKEERKGAFDEISEMITRYDGFIDSRKKAQEFIDIALNHLNTFKDNGADQAFSILEGMAWYVMERKK